jgi:hypothetical protein
MFTTFLHVFFTCLFSVSVCYAILGSCTPLLYRKKSRGRLSLNQLKVAQGDATFSQRIELFFKTFFLGFFTPGIYGIAVLLCIIVIAYKQYF